MNCENCDGKGVLGLTRGHRLIDCEPCGGRGYRCPDGGVCHHDCEDGGCFRVRACASFDADGSWGAYSVCPSGHPANGAPCVRYRCERLTSS